MTQQYASNSCNARQITEIYFQASSDSCVDNKYQAEWLANNKNHEETANKDYYEKYEEDEQFRSFVKTLLRSASEANLSSKNRNSANLGKTRKTSDIRDYTSQPIKSVKEKETMEIKPKHNDDIPSGRGKYQDMVRDRWGDRRKGDLRDGKEKFEEV